MLDGLKARLEQLLRDGARSDPRAYAAGLREALLEGKLGVGTMRDALAATERELAAERKQLEDAERRGRLAAAVPDPETVAIAERYAVRHRERVAVLERKILVQRDELVLAERELAEMSVEAQRATAGQPSESISAAWRDLESAGAVRPDEDARTAGRRRPAATRERDRGAARLSQEEARKTMSGDDAHAAMDRLYRGVSSRGPRRAPCRIHAASRTTALPAQQPVVAPAHLQKLAHTYSIVAYDSVTGDLGVAVQSKFPNVGGIVPWGRAGVGAVATQSLGNTAYGERGLDLIAQGATAEEALRIVMRTDTMLQDRQVGMVDARGNAASFTGTTHLRLGRRAGRCAFGRRQRPGGKGEVIVGRGYAAQANIMVSDQTVKNLAETFERSRGSLADRLMAALKAGQAGGGDKRGMQSAALLVVRKNGGYLGANDRFIDIRVYDAIDPIAELERLLALHKLHFFPSEPRGPDADQPAIVAQLEPILLTEPAKPAREVAEQDAGSATPAFLEALKNFMYWENYDVRVRMDGKIDRVVLDDILKKRKTVSASG